MKCELCKKNEASIYRFVPALSRQAVVCAACLSKVSALKPSIINILDDFIFESENNVEPMFAAGTVVCTNCGFEFNDYFETGRFGCVKCYDVFHERIKEIVQDIHGYTRHNGSRPSGTKRGGI